MVARDRGVGGAHCMHLPLRGAVSGGELPGGSEERLTSGEVESGMSRTVPEEESRDAPEESRDGTGTSSSSSSCVR